MKLITKIVGATLGLALAVGVGVGVAANNKVAVGLDAETDTVSFTAIGSTGKTGANKDEPISTTEYTTLTEFYYGNYTFKLKNCKKRDQDAPASLILTKKTGQFFNVTGMPGDITKVNVKTQAGASGSAKYGVAFSTTAYSSFTNNTTGTQNIAADSSKDFTCSVSNARYFCVYADSNQNNNGQVVDVVVTYEVPSKTLSSIALTGSYPTSFEQGDEFSHAGMTVTATYSDASSADVTASATFSGYDMSTAGDQTVTVSYTEGVITKTATYDISVAAATMYTVSGTIANGSLSSTASVKEGNPLNISIVPNEKYSAPETLSLVTMGGVTLTAGAGYTYVPSTGALSIASVTGNIVINATCVKSHGSWADNPYTVEEAIQAVKNGSGITGVYTQGIVCGYYNSGFSTTPKLSSGKLSFYFTSDGSVGQDGENATRLEAYFCYKSSPTVQFANLDEVPEIGDIVVVYGNLTLYNGTYEYAQNCYLESVTPKPCTVTYDGNGATSGSVPVDANQHARHSNVTTLDNTGSLVKTGFEFNGWNTNADPANGDHYDVGQVFEILDDITLYAEWLSTAPSITVQANLSGYTTASTSLSFSYGHIDNVSNISVVAADNKVTVGAISAADGSGTVAITFNTAGNTSLSFRNSGEELATCSVTITQSTVTITGLPATQNVFAGRTANLGNRISVQRVGAYTTNVVWNSDNESVATVNSSGVVTGVAVGTANITVTAVSDENVSMTCAVTVNALSTAYTIDFGATKNTNPSEIDTEVKFETAYAFTGKEEVVVSGFKKVYGTDNTNMLKMGSSSSNASITFTIPSEYYISAVSIDVDSAGGSSLNVKSGATGAETENQTIVAGTMFFNANLPSEKSNSVTLSSTANGAFYLTNITIAYVKTAKERVSTEASTESLLAYHYEKSGDDPFVYSNVVLRFGGFISVDLWNDLASECDIQGFGVMYAETDDLSGDSIKTWYETALDVANGDIDEAINSMSSFIGNAYVELTQSKTHPGAATTSQKAELGIDSGNYYMWNHREVLGDGELEKSFTAVAYIRIDNELVFLQQTSNSAKQAAIDLLDNDIYEDDAFDGSLYALAHLND